MVTPETVMENVCYGRIVSLVVVVVMVKGNPNSSVLYQFTNTN